MGAEYPSNMDMIKYLRDYEMLHYVDVPPHVKQFKNEEFYWPVLEITTKIGCSVNCRYCPQNLFCRRYFQKHHIQTMSLENFKTCVDKTPKNLIVRFAGFVEPFLNPEAVKMMQYAHKLGREISLFTTLVGLTRENFAAIRTLPFYRVVLHLPDKDGLAKIPMTQEYFSVLDDILNAKRTDGQAFVDRGSCQSTVHPLVSEAVKNHMLISEELNDRAGNLNEENLQKLLEYKYLRGISLNMYSAIEASNNIYLHLADDESRKIYVNRVMYSMTGEKEYIKNIIKMTAEGKWFVDQLNTDKLNFIFGAGLWGADLSQTWTGCWNGFLDNNEKIWNKEINGLLVSSPTALTKMNNKDLSCKIFIGTRLYYKEIENQLLSLGVCPQNIVNVGKILDDMALRQYFDLDELSHASNEVFVDVGCFDGKTAKSFVNWSKIYKHIYCFEPDQKNLNKCEANLVVLKNKGKVTIINKGVWSISGILHFDSKGNSGSAISDEGDKVLVTTLDDELMNENVTFVKMDVEGAELEVIKGAAKLIREKKPKLAISIYHKTTDILEIPQILLEYNKNYTFYMRHYSLVAAETVLYAI